MQAWVVPGAPFRDGWRLWYATDGAPPSSPRVSCQGQSLAVQFEHSAPVRLKGFPHSIYHARLQLPSPPPSGAACAVHIPETGLTYQWSTLPQGLPDAGLGFVFGSCFWLESDKGATLRALQDIISIESPRPLFKLLLGDQLYLDWPADVAPWTLARGGYALVGQRYRDYWGDPDYRAFLATLPNVMVGDDHEFWNNYPERQVHLPITYREGLRNDFAAAAADYYREFQARLNQPRLKDPLQAWTEVQLGPVSMFVADTRSQRSLHAAAQPQLMDAAQWAALERWQRQLKGPGLLALGQPLFQRDGDFRDYSLSNFVADYRRLLAVLHASAAGQNDEGRPHNIVILSGDIHNARSTHALIPDLHRLDPGSDFSRVHELIASASAAITGLSSPKPDPLPSFLPPGKADPWFKDAWEVQPVPGTVPYDPPPAAAPYACVDNNIGVLRLQPATTAPYSVTLSYLSYRVRSHHRPLLQRVLRPGQEQQGVSLIFSQTLNLQ